MGFLSKYKGKKSITAISLIKGSEESETTECEKTKSEITESLLCEILKCGSADLDKLLDTLCKIKRLGFEKHFNMKSLLDSLGFGETFEEKEENRYDFNIIVGSVFKNTIEEINDQFKISLKQDTHYTIYLNYLDSHLELKDNWETDFKQLNIKDKERIENIISYISF